MIYLNYLNILKRQKFQRKIITEAKNKGRRSLNLNKDEDFIINTIGNGKLRTINKIFNEVLNEICPTAEENKRIKKIIQKVKEIILTWNNSHDRYPIVDIIPQGSTGLKQTHLRDNSDIDLFIFLDPAYYKKYIIERKNTNDNAQIDNTFEYKDTSLNSKRLGNEKDETENVAEKNVAEKNATEKNVAEKNVAEKNATEKNVAEKNATEKNATEKNVAEKNAAEKNATEKNVAGKKEDCFIIFRENKAKLEELFKNLCINWIMEAFKSIGYNEIILSYAEHPYVSLNFEGFDIDIVFAFLLSSDYLQKFGPITAVDRTYHHTLFVQQNLTEKQRNEVRILKTFFKAQYSYGDKASTGRSGFIGYAIEILIYYFKDIINLLKNFPNLFNIAVDIFNRDLKDLRKIQRFQNDFLIIIDPTDRNRNVGSSISARAWIYCSNRIIQFLKHPEKKYFLEKSIKIKDYDKFLKELNQPSQNIWKGNKNNTESRESRERKESRDNYCVVEYKQLTNNHYTKIRDKLYSLARRISVNAKYDRYRKQMFKDVDFAIHFNINTKIFCLAFYTNTPNLEKTYLRRGPHIKDKKDVENFCRKYPNAFYKDNYFWVKTKRDYTSFIDFITDCIKSTSSTTIKEVALINISHPNYSITDEGKMALLILKNCVLPYSVKLNMILKKLGNNSGKRKHKKKRK
ncbi:MAG: hypothetical protein ACTSO2_05575 [Promethearchaeota archaeon]